MTDAAQRTRERLERIAGAGLPRILFVSHGGAGGVQRHIRDLAQVLSADAHVLLLQPHLDRFIRLGSLEAPEDSLWFDALADWPDLVAMLRAIGIDRIHVHHVEGLPRDVLDLPRVLGCPYDVTLHDYYPVCPTHHLVDGSGRYCGGQPGCQRCLEQGAAQWPVSIAEWRQVFRDFLSGAERVIAPSEDCAARVRAFFPELSPVVWPHPEPELRDVPSAFRVVVPGAISPVKGLHLLEACARDAHERGLPLHFRVIGHIAEPLPRWPELPLTVSGEYPEGRLEELLALERGDVAFFPAQCPETFSYTLSAVLATRLPIVTTNLGALPGRIAGRPNSHVVERNAAPAQFNETLLAAARAGSIAAPRAPARVSFKDYRDRYVAALRTARGSETSLPQIAPRWVVEPAGEPPPWTFIGLVHDALGRGRAIPMADLERRAHEGDSRLLTARGERDQAIAEAARHGEMLAARAAEIAALAAEGDKLRARLQEQQARAGTAEERVRELENSHSWRLTAPLRAAMRWLRRIP